MRYTNSGLIGYTKISPNQTSPRDHKIDRITPHCYVGQASAESMAGWLCNPAAQASANYGIADNGTIAMFVEEQDRSWCSSNRDNDMRAITIECASDVKEPYAINDTVYNRLIDLMTDICKRHGKTKLLWFGDKEKTLAYQPLDDEMVITVHRWFANKACPGDYIYNRLGKIAETVTERLGGTAEHEVYTPHEWISMIAPIAQDLAREYAVLPSVVIAQTALETGWGLTDPAKVIKVIRTGTGTDKNPEGYCTDPNYESKILTLIKQYNLARFDDAMPGYINPPEEPQKKYRVQVGAYRYKANATKRVKVVRRKSLLDCFIEKTDLYRVYCGSFESEENAQTRVNELTERNIKGAIVVPV